MAAGLPTIRADASERRAVDAADRNPPTCRPDAPAGDALTSAGTADSVIVVNDEQIVLGRIRRQDVDDPAANAEDVMRPGPTTVRAHEPLDPLLRRMAEKHVAEVIVSTPEGALLGVVRAAG